MADISDVETALAALVAQALYPSGTSAPSAIGADCRIYRGWPNSAALDSDLKAGVVNITIYPGDAGGWVTSRYLQEWRTDQVAPTLFCTVAGATVTFSGTAAQGQLAGLRIDDRTYAYAVRTGDTPLSVAANLASLASQDAIINLSGAAISAPAAFRVDARVVGSATALKEVRRQRQSIRVACWCPTPATRDAAAVTVDQALAAISFLDLADGTQARVVYAGSTVLDQSQNASLYRRDLLYTAEYPTLITQTQPEMLWGALGIAGAQVPA